MHHQHGIYKKGLVETRTSNFIWTSYLMVVLSLCSTRVGWSPFCWHDGLMAFLHFNPWLTKLRLKNVSGRSRLTLSLHLNFGLTSEADQSTTKFIIFFAHDVYSCRYKSPDNRSLPYLSTSSICWRSSLLPSSSVECCCFIFTSHMHQIIGWSLVLIHMTNLLLTLAMFHYHTKHTIDRGLKHFSTI